MEEQQKILAEEKKILSEEKGILKKIQRNLWLTSGIAALFVIAAIAFGVYLIAAQGRVSIENSTISAPSVDLASHSGGVLQEVFVNVGDIVPANTVVARVDTELIKTLSIGEVITVNNNIGKTFSPGQAIVTIIDPSQLRVVGKLQEDKGLQDVHIGQRATFTADAFPGKVYEGIVDEISPTANQGDVVFNISNARQEQDFDVKVRFDVNKYSELQNGMSAKITVFKS
jgi:multidrug resistance efflux pump